MVYELLRRTLTFLNYENCVVWEMIERRDTMIDLDAQQYFIKGLSIDDFVCTQDHMATVARLLIPEDLLDLLKFYFTQSSCLWDYVASVSWEIAEKVLWILCREWELGQLYTGIS